MKINTLFNVNDHKACEEAHLDASNLVNQWCDEGKTQAYCYRFACILLFQLLRQACHYEDETRIRVESAGELLVESVGISLSVVRLAKEMGVLDRDYADRLFAQHVMAEESVADVRVVARTPDTTSAIDEFDRLMKDALSGGDEADGEDERPEFLN